MLLPAGAEGFKRHNPNVETLPIENPCRREAQPPFATSLFDWWTRPARRLAAELLTLAAVQLSEVFTFETDEDLEKLEQNIDQRKPGHPGVRVCHSRAPILH